MFLDDKGWVPVEDLPGAISDLKTRLEAQKDLRHEYFGTRLVAKSARMRPMVCYPGWSLYEFRIDLDKLGSGNGYEAGHVYVLAGETQAVLLNGTSPPIHALNALTSGEGGASPLRLKDAQGRPLDAAHLEYLRFFCTFVAGEEGPFFIVESRKDLLSVVGHEDFKDLMADRRRNLGWPSPEVEIPFDAMREFLDATDRTPALEKLESSVQRPHDGQYIRQNPEDRLNRLAQTIGDRWGPMPLRRPDGNVLFEDGRVRAKGHVLYGRHLFEAQFAIAATGMVEMLNDEAVEPDLPIRTSKFDPNYPVLLRQDMRRETRPEELVQEIFNSPAPGQPRQPISNRLIRGDLNLKGRKLETRIDLEDVWITGDVILDDLRTPFSISMRKTWIGGALHARTLKCEGALALDRIHVHGLYDPSKPEFREGRNQDRVALSLRGAHVNSEIDLSRADVQGGMDLDDIEVGGTARLAGAQIRWRTKQPEYGLSARSGHFKRGLNIGVDVEERLGLKEHRPTRVVGPLGLDGAVIGGDIHLVSLVVADYLRCEPTDREQLERAVAGGATVYGVWETKKEEKDLTLLTTSPGSVDLGWTNIDGWVLAGSISASDVRLPGAKVGATVDLRGARLLGDLSAPGATINGFLDGDPLERTATRIDGNVLLSGAKIGSDTRFCGATIGGSLEIITGTLKRLLLRPAFVEKEPSTTCQPARVGGVRIHTVTVDSLDFCGLTVDGDPKDGAPRGSMELTGVNVLGDLGFFSKRPDIFLHYNLTPGEKKRCSLPEWCDIQATIPGNLTARSLFVGGEIDLTNLRIGGNGEFEGAKCGKLTALAVISKEFADAYIQVGGKCTERDLKLNAKSLNVDRLHCSGDADLSGIEIVDRVSARGARVDGAFAFFSEETLNSGKNNHTAMYSAKIGGPLDLWLLRTPTLAISGDTFLDADKARAEALSLNRAEIKELKLAGRVPIMTDLRDLKFDQLDTPGKRGDQRHRYVRELLRTSWPFDRSIYRTVERGLRNEGNDSRANAVYRGMRWRSLVSEMMPSQSRNWGAFRDGLRGMLRLPLLSPISAIGQSFEAAFLNLRERRVIGATYELTFGLLGRLFRWLFMLGEALFIGLLTGFWTRGYLLLLCLLPTVFISWLIYAVPQNITRTTYQLGESVRDNEVKYRKDPPGLSEWTMVERGRLLAATQIPVIPLIDGARWEPAENRDICLPQDAHFEPLKWLRYESSQCPQGTWAFWKGASPAGYALAVRALHWIAWPLFLIGISGIIQRRSGAQ